MMNSILEIHGVRIYSPPAEGAKIRTGRDASDLIAEAYPHIAQWIAIPVARLHEDFFRLRTGVAGEVVSKFGGYGLSAAFIGDISQYIENSDSFRDFVREANRGRGFWFVSSLEEFAQRLAVSQLRSATPEAQQ